MGQPRMSVVSSHDMHALGGHSIQTVMHCECNLIVFSGGPWIQQHKRRRFSKQGEGLFSQWHVLVIDASINV